MTWEFILSGGVAVLLIGFLAYALIHPDRF